MEEEQRFDDLLRQVGPIVPPPEVRQFVQDHLVQFACRKFLQQPSRDHDGRPEEAQSGRHSHLFRCTQRDLAPSLFAFQSVCYQRTDACSVQRYASVPKLVKMPHRSGHAGEQQYRNHRPGREQVKRPCFRDYHRRSSRSNLAVRPQSSRERQQRDRQQRRESDGETRSRILSPGKPQQYGGKETHREPFRQRID